ncbi:MAG TPA: hypothetical protein VGA13_05140 [Acidimicrobiales bacterium]
MDKGADAVDAVVAELSARDKGLGNDAESALNWLTGGQGPEALTQERVQQFCWYTLPMKFLTDADHHRRIAAALAEALDLLALPRYAAIARSDTTAEILAAYERSDAAGKKAFRTAHAASGIEPPDVPDLAWGSVMGWEESEALSSVAEMLELVIAAGDLVPGSRGWKQRQAELVRAHLTAPQLRLSGRSLLEAIRTERLETWFTLRRSDTRRDLLERLRAQLVEPGMLPAAVDDPVPRLRWLLGELVDGQRLTQTGNLIRAFVQRAAERFDWPFDNPPCTEPELYDLHQLRELAQRLKLVRKAKGQLTLTPLGRSLLDDPDALWRAAARGLVHDHPFDGAAGEVVLAVLATTETVEGDDLDAEVIQVVGETGWRESNTGALPSERDISHSRHQTTNLFRALGMLATGHDFAHRSYGLTEIGRLTAVEALRQMATGPRRSHW